MSDTKRTDVLEKSSSGILVAPTVVKISPAPQQQIIGDLSDEEEILHAPGLPQKKIESTP